jgi:hypothetical protein
MLKAFIDKTDSSTVESHLIELNWDYVLWIWFIYLFMLNFLQLSLFI